MATPYSLDGFEDPHALAWDTKRITESAGPSYQPWRKFWPPKNLDALSEDEIKSKPWLTWKRDETRPNDKPWYSWVNIFEGEVDEPCVKGGSCTACGGKGECHPASSTVAEGG